MRYYDNEKLLLFRRNNKVLDKLENYCAFFLNEKVKMQRMRDVCLQMVAICQGNEFHYFSTLFENYSKCRISISLILTLSTNFCPI